MRKNWKEIIEVVGIVAIVASLLFVGQQLRLDRQIAQNESWFLYVDNQIALSQLITEHVDIWTNGLSGADLSPSDRVKFNQIAYAVETKYLGRYARSTVGLRPGSANALALEFAHDLHAHVGLRQAVLGKWDRMKKAAGRESRIHIAVRQYLDKIDNGEIEPVASQYYPH